MQKENAQRFLFGIPVSLFFFLSLICGQMAAIPSTGSASDEICAQVVEVQGLVESRIAGQDTALLRPGVPVMVGEVLDLKPSSWLVLLTADSTLRKFNGPATITMSDDFSNAQGSVLARLGSALTGLLFTRREPSEVAMVTRMKEQWPGDDKMNLPLLIYPARGSSVVEKPDRFEWRKIEGVPLYRVSVYDWDHLMWQGTTSESHIQCPAEQCTFFPGERYYWGVEAMIGNTCLRSRSAEFKILPVDTDAQISKEFKRIDSSCSDTVLCDLIKIRLLLALNLYRDALELLDDSPFERTSSQNERYRLRAEILGMMGLYEEAFREYRNAPLKTTGK